MFILKGILILLGIIGFGYLSMYISNNFGEESTPGIVFIIVCYFFALYKSFNWLSVGKVDRSVRSLLVLVALLVAFTGWFIHPSQILSRASQKVSSTESSIYEHEHDINTSDDVKLNASRLERARISHRAAKLEYNAALIRNNGDPEYFKDATWSYVCWFFASLLLLTNLSNQYISSLTKTATKYREIYIQLQKTQQS